MASYYGDKKTGITYQMGDCSLSKRGFKQTAKLRNLQGLWIRFYNNAETGEVAISLDCSPKSDMVFQNRKDGNKWFKTYIEPLHGNQFVYSSV